MAAALGRGLKVARVRRLGGGIGSATSSVQLRDRSGRPLEVVIKRYHPRWPDMAPLEWERLTAAREVDVPSPEPLLLDQQGAWFGAPTLVISKLPGRPNLVPADRDAWVRQIAHTVSRLHAYDVRRARGALRRPHHASRWTPPDAAARWAPLYQRAAERVQTALPIRPAKRALCHGDFHPGNMLFQRDTLSGLVDWSSTRVGPAWFDVAYCRIELSLLFGVDTAEQFRAACADLLGPPPDELPVWDLMCALGAREWSHQWVLPYREQGARDISIHRFRARLRSFTARALAQLG